MSVKCRNSNKYYPLLMSKFIEDNTESKQNFIDFVNNFFLDADEVLGEFLGGEDVTPPITPKFKITQVDGRTNKEVIDNQTAREYYVRNRDYNQMMHAFEKRILKLSVFDSKDINTVVGDYTLLNKRLFDYKKELLNNIAKYINEVVDPNIDKLLDKDIEAIFNDIISKFENVINNYDQNNQKFKNVYNSYVILKTFDDLINSSIQFIQIDPKYIDSSVYSRNKYIYIGPKMRFYTGFSSDEFADIEDSISKVTELILNNSSKVDNKGKDIPHTSITTKEFNSVITKLWAWAKESKNPKVQEELSKQTLANVSKIISIYKNELANNRIKSDYIIFNVDVLNGIQKHIYDSDLDPQFKLMFTNLANKIIRPIYASYSENKKSESSKKKKSEEEKPKTTDLIVKNLTERVIKTQMTRFTELINGGRRYWSKYRKSFNDLLNKYHISISETEIKFDNVTITLNSDNRISINIDETVKTSDNYRQILYDFTTIIVPDNIDTLLSQQKLKGIKNYKDLYSVILAPILFDVYNRTISEINYGQLKDLSKIISIINGSDVSSVIKNSEGNNLPLFRLPCLIYLHKDLYNDIRNRLEETDKNSPYLINPIYQNIDRVKKPVIKAELNYNDQVKQSADWAFDSLIHTAIVCDYYHSLVGTQSYEENAKTASGIMSFQTTVFSDKNTHYNNLFDTNNDWQFAQFGKYNIRSILENYLRTNDSTEFDELIDKFRQITYSQYRTLTDKLISDYKEVFPDNTFDSLDDVEKFIQDHSINDIRNSFYSNNKEFIEEFHYSKTGGKNGINETLKFLLDIFSTKEKYNEFTEIQINWFLNHIKNNWETISSDSVIVSDFKNYLPQYVKDDKLLLESEGVLNPLIRSFYYLQTLISENYNSMMYGYLFYHPNKNNESTDAENYLIHCYSSRWTSQIKRMVIGGATYHPLAQGLKNGVLERVKMAVISDVDSNVRNISGMEDDVDSMDGSGYTNPYFSRMMNEALLDARVNGHVKKTIFHDIDAEYGTPKLLKWAEYEITNELRRNSKNLSLENIHKKMNNFPLSSFINFNKKYDNLYYVDSTNYETYQILEININNNVATRTVKDLTNGEIKIQTFKIETVYDLDQLYGGAWAKEINSLTNDLQFTEKNQDEVFNIICEFNLKNDIISWLVNKSALKVGASNLNPKGSWFDDTPLMYTTMSTKFGGLQMDADHDLNEAENRESTQMVSALEQNGFTHDTVKEIYNLIAQSAELSLKKISDAVKSNDKETLYKIFEEEIIKSFQTGEKDTWGLAQSFIRLVKKSANKTDTTFKIPFSSSSINGMFNATVISSLIKKGIRRYFDGVAAVINPSHNVINYYNIDGINYRFEELISKIRSDLKDTNFSKIPINEILNNEYVHNNNGELEQNPYVEDYSKDLIDYEDTIILSDSSIVKIDNYFKYIYYKHYYSEPVKIFKLKPKNLKASDTIFYSNDKRYSMFENKYTQLLYLLNNSELSKLSTFSKKDKKIKAIIKEYITDQLNNNSINVDDKIKNNIINNLFNLLKSELNSDINTPESLSKSLIDKLQDLLNDITDLKEIDWFGTKLKVDKSEVIPVQIVMGKLYAQQFGLLPGDSLAKIQQEKEKFFKKRIKSYYVNDNSDKFSYDWVLYDGTGNKLYVKLRKDNNIDILDKSSANSNYKVVNGKVYFKDKEICSENGKQFITYNDGEKQHDLVIIDDIDRFKEILNSGFFNHVHRNYRIDNYKDLVHEEFNDSIILLSNINKEGKIVIRNIAEYKTEKDIIRGLIINQKIKSDQEIWNLAKKRYESFIKSLNFIIVRIPCQSQQSFAPAQIAFFTDSTNNEVYVPTNIFWLEGSDLDIDKQYIYGHSVSDNGTIRTIFNEKQPEYIQQAALKNKIIEKQIEVITNPKNQINLTTPVTTNQVRKLSGKSELGKISKELQPFDPSSIFTMQIQTMTGKKVIGNVATGEKSFFALSYVYNEIFNSLYEALINNDFETVNYLLSKYTFIYTNVENNTPEIRTLANINLRKIKSILYVDQLENNKLIKVKNPAIPENIWNTLDQLVNFQSRISDKAADAGELLNSATDNVKELTLKKINADVNWSDLYIYALIKGESLEEIGNFILNPYISSVLNSYSSEDLTRDITDDKVEYIKKSFQQTIMLHGNDPVWKENINLHKRLIDYVVGAKEFSVLGKILKINQGFNTNTTELYTYIKSIEKYVESRLNKKLLDKRDKTLQDYRIAKNFGNKEEASKLYNLYLVAKNKVQTDWIKFDLMRFINDENYANEYINYYEKVKVLFNILEPIKIIPHYNVMYQTLYLAKQVLNTLSVRNKLEDIIWNNTIHKSLVSENSDITKKLTNNELKDLKKQINEFIINEWIFSERLSIPVVENAINNPAAYNLVLDNEKSLDTFIEYFENFVIPKLKSTLPDNKFISLLTFGYKDNKHFFRLPFDMMQIDSNEYTQSLYDDVLEAFNDLKYIKIEGIENNLVDLFYLYNLIINKDKLGPSSLTRIFEDIVSEKDSFVYKFNTWLDNQNADDLARKFFENKSEITKISEDDLDSEKDLTVIPLTEYTNYKITSNNNSKWSELSKIYGIKTIDYTDTYKELSNEDKEQIEYIYSEIAKNLKRNYYTSKDIRSSILQTLSADSIYAIGYIINPGELDNKGFKNELNRQIVNDDIIFTVEYGIVQKKPVYVFDQKTESWYKWDYNLNSFQKTDTPILTPNFTSIESKNLTESGINAIENVFEKTQEFVWGDNPNSIYDYNLDPEISFETYVNYTGFAQGSDTEWIEQSKLLGIDSVDTTKEYNDLNDGDKEDIEQKYLYVVDRLKRKVLDKDTAAGKLVRRDILQARNADSIIAIGNILKPNEFNSKGYENKTDKEQVSGGTAYAIEFAKLLHKPIFVFNQRDNKWYFWDYANQKYSETDTPILTVNFAGIGTREITESGKRAIQDVLNKTKQYFERNLSSDQSISQTVDFYSTTADEISIEYTPKGKTTQTYIVKKSHIYNKNGKEVFTTDSVDRTKIYANVAVKENRAVIVNLNDSESYVVTNNNDIISITTGKLMKWNDTDSKRIKILELAKEKFNKKQSINLTNNSESSNNTFKFNDGYEIETPFELNDEQKNALNKINDFINSDKNIITLSGYAGTGKTSLMEILASKWSSEGENVGFTATTHKATSVLKSKVQKYDFKTYTMHSLFGIQPSVDLNMSEFDIRKTIDGYIAKKSYPNIIVIDEASMINQEHYNFIRELAERNDLKIIFIGDPAQLKPVKSTDISPIFKNNDGEIIFLTKVERTDNNAILKTATNIRNNKELTYQTELNDKNEGIIYLQPSTSLIKKVILDNIDLIKEDINSFKILAFTNKKVQTYNELVRSLLNYDETPHIGEPIMMYDNKNRKKNQYQLINSELYEIVNVEESQLTKYLENINDSVFLKGWNLYLKDIDGNISSLFVIKVNQNDVEDLKKISKEIKLLWTKYSVTKNYRIYEQIQDLQNLLNVDKNITGPFGNVLVKKVWDFGYAHTIHKSQGSTYEKVLIDGDDIELAKTNEDVKQLKYVGITRAQKQVFYISTNTKLNNGNSNSDEIKKIAENWSKLEGLNTNLFYSEVLPRINECVQIFYKLSDDQDSSVKAEANMSFSFGDYKRSDIKSNSINEAIKNGERTASTSFKNIELWKSLKKGDRIKFVSKETGDYVVVEITEPARKIIPESQDFYKTKPSIKAQLIEFIKSADNKYLHITTDANLLNEDASIRNAKGFIRNGEIYINVDRATNDTIIHEFGHLYLALSKITDTDKYYKILSKVRQTNLWTKLRQWDSYKNKRGSDFDEEVLAFMISNYYQGDLTYKDIVNEILEIVPNEFKDLLNSDILPILDESIITNYRLQQKIATIKNKLYNDDILKEDCK